MVTPLLRGAEIDACVHRITLARAEPTRAHRTPVSPEIERRRHEAEHHRRTVVERLVELHPGAVVATGHEHTVALVGDGVELILDARLADVEARRTITAHALVRVGRVDDRFTYAPLVIKNHEVTEAASSRRLHEGSLDRLMPSDVAVRDGLGLRATVTVRRDVLLLDGATRVLQAFAAADPSTRGALVDRNCRVWWLDLSSPTYSRSNLSAYDSFYRARLAAFAAADPSTRGALVDRNCRVWWLDLSSPTYSRSNLSAYDSFYRERLDVLTALDEWFDVGGAFPTSPYWHRECLTCEFSEHCHGELESIDDVSLTRFTTIDH